MSDAKGLPDAESAPRPGTPRRLPQRLTTMDYQVPRPSPQLGGSVRPARLRRRRRRRARCVSHQCTTDAQQDAIKQRVFGRLPRHLQHELRTVLAEHGGGPINHLPLIDGRPKLDDGSGGSGWFSSGNSLWHETIVQTEEIPGKVDRRPATACTHARPSEGGSPTVKGLRGAAEVCNPAESVLSSKQDQQETASAGGG